MNSDDGNGCSHPLGFPIRISPDHSLLAASRGFSQLTASFIAYLRQGIHTHALSSLTIKSILNTDVFYFCASHLLVVNARQYSIVKDHCCKLVLQKLLVGLGRIELPTSPLSGVRSSQLSYRPKPAAGLIPATTGGAGRDRTGDLLNANQALSQLSYSPW